MPAKETRERNPGDDDRSGEHNVFGKNHREFKGLGVRCGLGEHKNSGKVGPDREEAEGTS